MNSKMTPCEKLGYKVGDKFKVVDGTGVHYAVGSFITLIHDDGSSCPRFNGVHAIYESGDSFFHLDFVEKVAKLKPAKQALADAIHQNGGWPQDSEWSVQNGEHGRISFSVNKPVRHDSKSWMAKGGFNFKIEVCKPLKNWHQCVLSREEYYQAYPKAGADGWIEWKGGECPVEGSSIVDVELNGGRILSGLAISFSWLHERVSCNIIKYRKHKKPKAQPECLGQINPIIHASIDELCAKVTEENKHQHVDAKPTIEQLAQDYRNKLDFANSKQQEADEAKVAADAALGELERAGDALGLLIGIAKPDREPELVITDWRDLRVGDKVECIRSNISKYSGVTGVVRKIDYDDTTTPVCVDIEGVGGIWCHEVKFISRP